MSHSVLFTCLDGTFLSKRASSPHQCGSSAAPGQRCLCGGGRRAFQTILSRQTSGLSIPQGGLSVFPSAEHSRRESGSDRQASGQSDRSATQPTSADRAIVKRLCLPSATARSPRTTPTTTWPHTIIRNPFRSSLRAGQTGSARTGFLVLIASWFLKTPHC